MNDLAFAEDGQFSKLSSETATDHLARLENNKRMVHHKMVKAREYQKQQFEPGSYAYLSSEGILMPF
eukprot:SAG11_NODE_4048_length_2087_cov_1.479376_2_plen_67_part_00